MRFATKQDIEAPIEDAFRILSDFEAWERSIMRRGIEVARLDKLTSVSAGIRWKSRFTFRGKLHNVEVELTKIDPSNLLSFAMQTQSIHGTGSFELMELSSKRTRLHVVAEIIPQTMAARIFMQSLRLARGKMDRSFEQRVAQLSGDLENRFRAAKKA